MYQLAVQRDFVAQHYLIGGDWGDENELHSHHYQLEVTVQAGTLNQHGYLVDIVELEGELEALIAKYRDKTLNDLIQFEGLNPSLEHFSRILAQELTSQIDTSNLLALTVSLWEDKIAWASFQMELPSER